MNVIKEQLLSTVSTRCATAVHKKMIAKILRAPVNLYYDVTPTGTIVNRLHGIDVLDYHFKGTIQHMIGCILGIFQVLVLLLVTSW